MVFTNPFSLRPFVQPISPSIASNHRQHCISICHRIEIRGVTQLRPPLLLGEVKSTARTNIRTELYKIEVA